MISFNSECRIRQWGCPNTILAWEYAKLDVYRESLDHTLYLLIRFRWVTNRRPPSMYFRFVYDPYLVRIYPDDFIG